MRRVLLSGLVFATACLSGLTPSVVASLLVSSNISPSGVFVGDQIQVNASALDISGAPVPSAVTYATSNASIAIVSTSGLISVLAPGSVTITISAGSQSRRLAFTVDPDVSASMQINPSAATVPVGSQQTLTATVITSLGNPARNKTVVWSTADATKVTVDQSGTITGVAPASGVQVCATAGDAPSVKACATVTVQ